MKISSHRDEKFLNSGCGVNDGVNNLFLLQRMSMMLSGFGWRKASLMNVLCAHSILL